MPDERRDARRQRRRRQRAGGDDHRAARRRGIGHVGHFLAHHGDERVGRRPPRSPRSANRSRSTASAAPAGTRTASATRITSEPSRRISSLRRPTALSSLSLRKELLQTSSARLVGPVHRRRAHRPHLVDRRPAGRARRPATRPRTRPGRRRCTWIMRLRTTSGASGSSPAARRRRDAAAPGRLLPRPRRRPRRRAARRPRADRSLGRVGALRQRRVRRAVGHVRAVPAVEQLDRRARVLARAQLAQHRPRRPTAGAAPASARRAAPAPAPGSTV